VVAKVQVMEVLLLGAAVVVVKVGVGRAAEGVKAGVAVEARAAEVRGVVVRGAVAREVVVVEAGEASAVEGAVGVVDHVVVGVVAEAGAGAAKSPRVQQSWTKS